MGSHFLVKPPTGAPHAKNMWTRIVLTPSCDAPLTHGWFSQPTVLHARFRVGYFLSCEMAQPPATCVTVLLIISVRIYGGGVEIILQLNLIRNSRNLIFNYDRNVSSYKCWCERGTDKYQKRLFLCKKKIGIGKHRVYVHFIKQIKFALYFKYNKQVTLRRTDISAWRLV